MRVVYVDTLFFLNLTVDYLLLLTARITGEYVSRRYLFVGAAVGALLAVLLFFPPLPMWLSLVLRAGTCGGTVLSAFAERPAKAWPKVFGVFVLLTVLLAGAVFAITQMTGRISLQNGTIYYEISNTVMLLSFTCVFALSKLVLGKGQAYSGRSWREITVENGTGRACFRALADSGNLLRDPINGRRVIVTDLAALQPLITIEETDLRQKLQESQPDERLSLLRDGFQSPFWLLPVHTVMQTGMMPVFRPQRIFIDGNEQDGYLLGIASGPLNIGGDCLAVMGV